MDFPGGVAGEALRPPCLLPAPTHKSPISRMLLRYRWQSCSTCPEGETRREDKGARAFVGGGGGGEPSRHLLPCMGCGQQAGQASLELRDTDAGTALILKDAALCLPGVFKRRQMQGPGPRTSGYSRWGARLEGPCGGRGRTSS